MADNKVHRCKGCREEIRWKTINGKKRPFGCKCKEGYRGGTWYNWHKASHPITPNVSDLELWIKYIFIPTPKDKISNPIIIVMNKDKFELEMELTEPSSAKYDIKKVQDQIFTIEYESERNCILTAPFGTTSLMFKAQIYPTTQQGLLFDD